MGYLTFQSQMYETMFGRWASTGLGSALAYLGPSAASVVQPAILLAWLGAFTWCAFTFTRRLSLSLMLALLVILSVVSVTGDSVDGLQAVYWQTASVTYVAPFIVAATGIAASVRTRSFAIAAIAGFVAAGFNEAFMVVEIAALSLAVLLARSWRLLAASALLGALLSAAVVVASPGNDSRIDQLHQPSMDGMFSLTPQTLRSLLSEVTASPVFILGFLATLLVGRQVRPGLPEVIIVVAAALLVLCAVVPSLYAMQVLLPRTSIVPYAVLGLAVMLMGLRLGGRLAPHPAGALLIPIVSVAFAVFALKQFSPVQSEFEVFTRQWSEQQAQLKSVSGIEAPVVVTPVDSPVNVWRVNERPESYVNQCISQFYETGPVRTP
jgi:hypothetical protein